MPDRTGHAAHGDERVRELYGRAGPAAFAGNLIVVLLVIEVMVIVWPMVGPVRVVLWGALMLALQAGLVALIAAFHRRPPAEQSLGRWGKARTAVEAAHGLGWALAFPLLHAPSAPIDLLALMVTIVGLTSGMAASLAVYLPCLIAFCATAMLPAAGYLLIVPGDRLELYAAGMMTTTFALVVANATRMSLLYDEAIRLRLATAAQAEERLALQEAAEDGRRVAEVAVAERTRFFGQASHDLRQPVHALGLYSSLLRNNPPAAERRLLLDHIASCVDSLERLFTAILGMAEASAPRDPPRPVGLPVQDVLDRVLLQCQPEAARRGLSLRGRSSPAWIYADPAAVERILSNLVSNALRYTDRGGVLVGVRRRGGRLDVMVADSGVGLSEGDRHRIFEPFFQVRRPNRDAGGSGLGLATVRELCLAHDYEIQVRSQLGRGSVFRLSLPPAEPRAPAPPLAPTPGRAAASSPLNVLVLEDDPLAADALGRLLRAWGLTVHVTADPDEALRLIAPGPGVRWHALLDYALGGGATGLEVAKRIRSRHGASVGLSLLTGESDPAIFVAARRSGLTLLHKPVKPIRLRALLASAAAATDS